MSAAMAAFGPDTPLGQIRAWLRVKGLQSDGARCPACDQHVKLYRRKLNSGMARSLIAMYQAGGTNFIHLPTTIGARSREEGKLRYWGLVEEQAASRPDGGRAGYWRVTDKGAAFVGGVITVPRYAHVFNKTLHKLSGEPIGIREALGDDFSYDELMNEPGGPLDGS